MENVYDATSAGFYRYSPALSRRADHPSVAFYVDECRRTGDPVLEVGSGTGTYTLPLALAGLNVIGIDQSPAMLQVLERRLMEHGGDVRDRVTLHVQDMRSIHVTARCRTALLPGNVFLMNLSVEDQLQSLHSIWASLDDGGYLILEAFTPDLKLIAGVSNERSPRQYTFAVPGGTRYRCLKTIRVDRDRQLLHHEIVHERIQTPGAPLERHITEVIYRYCFPWELIFLLRLGGFKIVHCFGDFETRRPKTQYEGYQVIIARKNDTEDAVALACELRDLALPGSRAPDGDTT